jgi:hypothetical protein
MRSDTITYPGVGVAVGGLFGALGVFADWFSYTATIAGGRLTIGISGTEDWSGRIAVVAGFSALLFGAAYLLLQDPAIRRWTGVAMGASSAVLLVMTLFGVLRVNAVVPNAVVGSGLGDIPFSASVAAGLGVSFIGGVVAFVSSFLAIRWPETGSDVVAETAEVPAEAAVEAG